jgi:integrase
MSPLAGSGAVSVFRHGGSTTAAPTSANLLALRWSDVDWDTRTVRITKNRVVVNGEVVEGAPKTKRSRRTVSISAETVAVLRRWRLAQTPSDYVFTDELDEPVRPDRVNHLFRQACGAAGVSDIGRHGMRHTSATLALKAGVPLHVDDDHCGPLRPRARGPGRGRHHGPRRCLRRGRIMSTSYGIDPRDTS